MQLLNPIEINLTELLRRARRIESFDKFEQSRIEVEDSDIKKIRIHDIEERDRMIASLNFLKREVCKVIGDLLKD